MTIPLYEPKSKGIFTGEDLKKLWKDSEFPHKFLPQFRETICSFYLGNYVEQQDLFVVPSLFPQSIPEEFNSIWRPYVENKKQFTRIYHLDNQVTSIMSRLLVSLLEKNFIPVLVW